MTNLTRTHERIDGRLDAVENGVNELRSEVKKSVPIAWFRSTWGLIMGALALSGGVLGIVLLLEKLRVIP